MKVLSVTNSYPANALTQADAIVDSLEGPTLTKLNRLAGQIRLCYFPDMKSATLTDQLSAFLFWDVDPSGINPETHRQFIIPRVMERGTLTDVRAVWEYYGSETVKSVLLNAADLSAKTISFFANQFNLPRDAFRAFRNPASHWAA